MTLAEFLVARIAEDERNCATNGEPENWCDRAEGDHYDSKRVLAEVAAKRAILSDHVNANAYDGDDWDVTGEYALPAICSRCEDRKRHDAAAWPCPTLRALALPYADHPDYDDAWRPV